ncbi:MAG TPA: hypothetical protein VFC78_12310 [Tepidisphaeraceae bacterium]|nr:hypothetical protein [Tepidisphaeraceae bacterium]
MESHMHDPFRPKELGVIARKALMTLRIIWFALMMGQLVFFAIIVVAILPTVHPAHVQPMLNWVSVAMLITAAPITFFIRAMIFRRFRAEDGVRRAGYCTGNIVFWAGCETATFFGLVVAMINGSLWPTIWVVAIALLLQVLTFPTAGGLSASEDAVARSG